MTNHAWWARVVQDRTERDDLRLQRVSTLHKGDHAAATDLKAVPGIGVEIVLTVDGSCARRACSDRTSRRRGNRGDAARCSNASGMVQNGIDRYPTED
jgi:hypothetical protein